jgi:acyl-CoA reductase-like NAD-dependent aldehyde dehydrogenase
MSVAGLERRPMFDPQEVAAPASIVERARTAQREWASLSLSHRLKVVRKLRNAIAAGSDALLSVFPPDLARSEAESLIAEVLPLADACRFLEKEAPVLLEPETLETNSRPFWMRSVEVQLRRDPLGVVLVIGPANYPLFLVGVHTIQALTAGNAVVVKPGVGGSRVLKVLRGLALQAGIPPDLLSVVDESIQSAQDMIATGVDKIVMTGSLDAGRSVYRSAAEALVPVALELTGDDPVFVLESADVKRAVSAIAFGRRWNDGNTCIAPRRVFVHYSLAGQFAHEMAGVATDFGKLPIKAFRDEEDALIRAAASPDALGASVFGELQAAHRFGATVDAGVVVINDVIAPTADPRVPFCGRRSSGFGATRGAEGLLQFTTIKAVLAQRARRLRHLEPLPPNARELFTAYLNACHGSRWSDRIRAILRLVTTAVRTKEKQS